MAFFKKPKKNRWVGFFEENGFFSTLVPMLNVKFELEN